ncbi:MAG TPA: Tex family protein [Terriglobia bacterium]|nr:Tex family protein [Terriglobia bacterium]
MELQDIILSRISLEAAVKPEQVKATVALLADQATVPFIARYRKEVTANLDEVQIRTIAERLEYYLDLLARRETILKSIEDQGKLSDDLKQKILACYEKHELEDLYLPFKPKRKTKASLAITRGLDPLARFIWAQSPGEKSIEELADTFVNTEKEVNTREEAIEGALHIIAEWISENLEFRRGLRDIMLQEGVVVSKVVKGKEDQKTKFEMYYDFREPASKIPSHRMLAIRRGVKEQTLSYTIEIDSERALRLIQNQVSQDPQSPFAPYLEKAVRDSYERLLLPSIQAEVRSILKERSDLEAIEVFEANLSNLLLAPPAGLLTVMGIDPGYRTGCKVAVVDETGKFLEHATIYPTEPKKNIAGADWTLYRLVQKHQIKAIAIGNGTASRETDSFVRDFIRKYQGGETFVPPPKPEKRVVTPPPAETQSLSAPSSSGTPSESITETGSIGGGELKVELESVSASDLTEENESIGTEKEGAVLNSDLPVTSQQVPIMNLEPDFHQATPGVGLETEPTNAATNDRQDALVEEKASPQAPLQTSQQPMDKRHSIFSITVNESGASVYSASEGARREFPRLDVTVRGAISIARRLQDPLAELVKIHPKSIGVGQYQHDVDQKRLKQGLESTVESAVNHVGVDLNTASYELLQYVSGLNKGLARNIVEYRHQRGPYTSRTRLMEVPGFGEKSFEQAAGFLRIKSGENPLDATAVHPESYPIVERIAQVLGVSVSELVESGRKLVEHVDVKQFMDEKAGVFTLNDIKQELLKPGRDPRDQFVVPAFRDDVKEVSDLKDGMVLEGTVTNVTNFGAFVDIGVHQDGLVHVSELSNRFVKDPREAVHVGEIVKVKVIGVDVAMKRISLSMKALLPKPKRQRPQRSERRAKRPVLPQISVNVNVRQIQESDHLPKPLEKPRTMAPKKLPRPVNPNPPRPRNPSRAESKEPPRRERPLGSLGKPDTQQAQSLSFAERIRLLQEKFGGIR